MCDNYRILSPVGQGGFDIECIDGTTVVYDCGSSAMYHVNNCIGWYHQFVEECGRPAVVDYVFLSHFDNDHVNGLKTLSKLFKIENIIVPYIPREYRVMYNYLTDNAVKSFHALLTSDNFSGVGIIGSRFSSDWKRNRYCTIKSKNRKWEWIYKSLFSVCQWEKLNVELQEAGIVLDKQSKCDDFFDDDFRRSSDTGLWDEEIQSVVEGWEMADSRQEMLGDKLDSISIDEFDIESYIGEIQLTDDQIKKINDIIGGIPGVRSGRSFAKNENGLMLLSKKCGDVKTAILYPAPFEWQFNPTVLAQWQYMRRQYDSDDLSACIYTGDMRFDVKSCPTILNFLRMTKEPLLLFQIPHHGSPNNSSLDYLQSFPSMLFFWHDKNYKRFNNISSKPILKNRCLIIDTTVGLVCCIKYL